MLYLNTSLICKNLVFFKLPIVRLCLEVHECDYQIKQLESFLLYLASCH